MIEPLDDDERARLIRELLVERFGSRPRRPAAADPPRLVAHRRRVLCGLDKRAAA